MSESSNKSYREKYIKIALSAEEYSQLKEKSQSVCLPVASFARSIIFQHLNS